MPESKRVKDSRTEQVQILMPEHINGYGRLFGGKLVEWIDVVAGVVARRHSGRNITTLCIDNLHFKEPAYVNDTIVLSGRVTYVGKTSMEGHAAGQPRVPGDGGPGRKRKAHPRPRPHPGNGGGPAGMASGRPAHPSAQGAHADRALIFCLCRGGLPVKNTDKGKPPLPENATYLCKHCGKTIRADGTSGSAVCDGGNHNSDCFAHFGRN